MILQLSLILSVSYAWLEFYVIQFERYFMISFSLVAYIHILRNYKNNIIHFLLAFGWKSFFSGWRNIGYVPAPN